MQLSPMSMRRAWKRMRAGLPLVMLTAQGPGRIAFSHDRAGEVIALPVEAGASIDVCEGRLLTASEGVDYDWQDSNVWYSTSGGTDAADTGAGLSVLKVGTQVWPAWPTTTAMTAGTKPSGTTRSGATSTTSRRGSSPGWS